ncbi:hypothetical protein H671_2g5990 [Cricetulus griseus]|uniref:Uncharacterized protein n=1 Tax=Cricetulus griseus TaxID=10029 RepID=A0A061IHX5_CRIGR|nr:hypothetical protein H671_2g5990 [Cricetulus griseus]
MRICDAEKTQERNASSSKGTLNLYRSQLSQHVLYNPACDLCVTKCNLKFLNWILFFVYMVDYIDGFLYVEPSLHPWAEAYLIIMDDFSDVLLDLNCQYFVEYFCIMFLRDIGL